MPEPARAQLYLSLETAQTGRLEAILHDASPACVRLCITDHTERDIAETCRALCHAREIPLLIAGPEEAAIALARTIGADGVHLTGAPKAAPWVRGELGEDCIVGIDPGPSRHDAMLAAETGADYVSFAPDWLSDDSLPETLAWWAAMIETPMVVENAGTPARIRTVAPVAEFVLAGADNAGKMASALSAR